MFKMANFMLYILYQTLKRKLHDQVLWLNFPMSHTDWKKVSRFVLSLTCGWLSLSVYGHLINFKIWEEGGSGVIDNLIMELELGFSIWSLTMIKMNFQPTLVAHACNFSTVEVRQENYKFEGSLGYIAR
jgi:hypothetical protein